MGEVLRIRTGKIPGGSRVTDYRQQTIDVYDATADRMAQKFRDIGARVSDIDEAIRLAGNPDNPNVFEIGCGDGRDAKAILERTNHYLGIDVSKEFIRIANAYLPDAKFATGDAVTFDFPGQTDVIFAFASLLHLNQDEVSRILEKAHASLNPGGIFYISLKWAEEYSNELKRDEFGERMFYFYTPELIESLAGTGWQAVYTDRQSRPGANHIEWFTIALKKR